MTDIDVREEYRALGARYDDLEALLEWPDERLFRIDEDVSGWSAAHHLYHVALSNSRMLKAAEVICAGHPMVRPEAALNEAGRRAMARGGIERGRGKAPEHVAPPETVTRADLEKVLARSRKKYAETEALLPVLPTRTGGLPHPYMGTLRADEWLRLARVHSDHHLAIIRELAAGTASPETSG
jgi:hypothetical protein